jgi:hypothetical protein
MKIKPIYFIYGIGLTLITILVYSKLKKFKPIKVNGSFKANNCDELHAFENTHGKIIGGMSTKVNKELEKLYNEGINPIVSKVSVEMDSKSMTVNWEVEITESKDKKAWVGFTSRGASGNDAFTRANSKNVGQDKSSILSKIKNDKQESNAELKEIYDFKHNLDANGKPTGSCPTRQFFYVYTRPNKFPSK